MTTKNRSLEHLTLHLLLLEHPGVVRVLLKRFGTPERVLRAPRAALGATDQEWAMLHTLRASADWRGAEAQIARAEQLGVVLLSIDDRRYPPLLREIPDPPLVLFVRGDPLWLHRPAVAVVGSRKASDYGRRVVEELVPALCQAGLSITSGLALGIDAAAHRAALAAGGCTIGVLASGVDLITPSSHHALGESLVRHGALCSEYPLGTSPKAYFYPQRNRIISGLCGGVLVVECRGASGTMWTARHAVDQGRLVFAVPGPVGHLTTEGPHQLIRDGAILATHPDHLLVYLLPGFCPRPSSPRSDVPTRPAVSAGPGAQACAGATPETGQVGEDGAMADPLLSWLAAPRTMHDIVARTGEPVPQTLARLTSLEAAGAIRVTPEGLYQRT